MCTGIGIVFPLLRNYSTSLEKPAAVKAARFSIIVIHSFKGGEKSVVEKCMKCRQRLSFIPGNEHRTLPLRAGAK